jgi:hypothetical protein
VNKCAPRRVWKLYVVVMKISRSPTKTRASVKNYTLAIKRTTEAVHKSVRRTEKRPSVVVMKDSSWKKMPSLVKRFHHVN